MSNDALSLQRLKPIRANARNNFDLVVANGFVFVTSLAAGTIKVFRIDPRQSFPLVNTISFGSVAGAAVGLVGLAAFSRGSKTYLVVASRNELILFDISTAAYVEQNPSPPIVSRTDITTLVRSLVVLNIVVAPNTRTAYLYTKVDFFAVDLTHVKKPVPAFNTAVTLPGADFSLLGSVFVDATSRVLYVAYVASRTMAVFDVSDPVRPVLRAQMLTRLTALDFDQRGSLLAVGDALGLEFFDISQPLKPTSLGAFNTSGKDRTMSTVGFYGRLHLLVLSFGVQNRVTVYRLRRNGNGRVSLAVETEAKLTNGYSPWDFEIANGYLFVSNSGQANLDVFKIK